MTAWRLRAIVRKEMLIVCAIIFAIRIYQYFTSASVAIQDLYLAITPISLATFLLAPLFVLPLTKIVAAFTNFVLAIRVKTSFSLTTCYCFFVFLAALAYVLIVNVTAFALMFVLGVIPFTYSLQIPITLLCQTLFYEICALLFYLVFSLARKSFVAYILLLCYIVWDYMTFFIPAKLPMIGWGLTQFSVQELNYAQVTSNLSFLVFITEALIILNLFVNRKQEYIESIGV
jgi:hypothetical protein